MNNNNSNISKGVVLLVATISSFFTPFMGSAVNIALPPIAKEFGVDAVTLGWVATSYSLTAAMFLIPFGRIADIYGRKRIFTYGIIIYTIPCLLVTFCKSAIILIALRAIQGIGGAMTYGTGIAILVSVFPPGERGRALGINVASTYAGLSLGPILGGLLTQHFGWRSIFLTNVPLGLIILVTVLWKLKSEWAEAKGENLDLAGSTIYGLSLAALIYGFSSLPAVWGVWLVAISVLGILSFIGWEIRAKSPVLNISLFRNNTVFSLSNLAALINYMATSAVTFLLSVYLQYNKGVSPEHAGLILVSQPFVMAVLSPVAGRLSDKLEPRVVASIGMALTTLGLSLLIFVDQDTSLQSILLSLVILGLGFALFSSPNTNAVMSSVEKRFYGVASGILGTMRLTGQMLSLGIVMLLFALFIGRAQITPEYYPLFLRTAKTAFTIFAVLCFGGIFASLARGRVRGEGKGD